MCGKTRIPRDMCAAGQTRYLYLGKTQHYDTGYYALLFVEVVIMKSLDLRRQQARFPLSDCKICIPDP